MFRVGQQPFRPIESQGKKNSNSANYYVLSHSLAPSEITTLKDRGQDKYNSQNRRKTPESLKIETRDVKDRGKIFIQNIDKGILQTIKGSVYYDNI